MTATLTTGYPWETATQSPVTVVLPTSATGTSNTQLADVDEHDWKHTTVRRIASLLSQGDRVNARCFVNLVAWMSELPEMLPAPSVMLADNGSIHLEWSVSKTLLYVTFYEETEEAYFVSQTGLEQETSTVRGSRTVYDAINEIGHLTYIGHG